MERFVEIEHQQYKLFQLSLFADLAWYAGVTEPVAVIEHVAHRAAISDLSSKRWSRQVTRYIVDALNLRLFDWGGSYILFSHRLVRIFGSKSAFSLERVLDSWFRQVASLSPQHSLTESSVKLAMESVYPHTDRALPWHHRLDPTRSSLGAPKKWQKDTSKVYQSGADFPPSASSWNMLVAETADEPPPAEIDPCCCLFELGRKYLRTKCCQIIPIVKTTHVVPWVDEMERARTKLIVQQL